MLLFTILNFWVKPFSRTLQNVTSSWKENSDSKFAKPHRIKGALDQPSAKWTTSINHFFNVRADFFCSVYALASSVVFLCTGFFCVFCVRPQSLWTTSARVRGHTWVPDAGLIEGTSLLSSRSALSWAAVSSSSSISSSVWLLGVAILPAGESVVELVDFLRTGVLLLAGVWVSLP